MSSNVGSDEDLGPEQPLRILQVLRAPVGGLFRHVCDLTRGLVARGHDVGLVIDDSPVPPRWDSLIQELTAVASLGVSRVSMSRAVSGQDVGAVRHVHARILDCRADVVHGHGAKGGAYARIAGTLAQTRPLRVYTPHGGSLHYAQRSPEGIVYHALERWLANWSDIILFESAFSRAAFARVVNMSTPDWPVVHNGLPPDDFEPAPHGPDATDLVFLGELRALKGIDVLLDALELAPEVSCTLVGSGPDEVRVRERSARLGPRVRVLPPVPARHAFALGRVVVVPSLAESLPYVVLEAIAACKPVLTTNVGGIGEIFLGHEERLLPSGDAVALANAIRWTLESPEVALAQARTLRESVRARFSLDGMVDQIVTAYRFKMRAAKTDPVKRSKRFSQ